VAAVTPVTPEALARRFDAARAAPRLVLLLSPT
jgi:hypothetical protein